MSCSLLAGEAGSDVKLAVEELLEEELEAMEDERDLGGGEVERDLGREGADGGSGVFSLGSRSCKSSSMASYGGSPGLLILAGSSTGREVELVRIPLVIARECV